MIRKNKRSKEEDKNYSKKNKNKVKEVEPDLSYKNSSIFIYWN